MEMAKKEEMKKEEMIKEKIRMEQFLKVKVDELTRTSIECAKLQERNLGLAKEVAALKLATDLNLGEEEMVKLASLGNGSNPANAIDVLKRSLALRNKSYKELIAQCNHMGRSDTNARRKLEKSKEKILKLKTRMHELEKALEEKENELLRNLASSHKYKAAKPLEKMAKPNQINFSSNHSNYMKRNANSPEAQNASAYVASTNDEAVIDLDTESFFMDVDGFKPSPELKMDQALDSDLPKLVMPAKTTAPFTNSEPFVFQGNSLLDASCRSSIDMKNNKEGTSERLVARKVTHTESSTWTTETLLIDDISKQTPIAVKKETHTYDSSATLGGHFGPESANRSIGKWCKSLSHKTTSSSGDLISVGSDGRGGRVKVLRDHNQNLDGNAITFSLKKHKTGAKKSGQFHIEHFFGKTEN